MGIDTDGGMTLGEKGEMLAIPDDWEGDLQEWAEENDMNWLSPWYDSDIEDCFFGFMIPDIPASEMTIEWLNNIQRQADKFQELTSCPARLIGMQDVT